MDSTKKLPTWGRGCQKSGKNTDVVYGGSLKLKRLNCSLSWCHPLGSRVQTELSTDQLIFSTWLLKDPFSCLYPINYLVWCYKISPNCLKGWAPSQNTVPPSARPISSFWKRGGIYGMIRTFRLHTSTTYSINLKLVEHSFWKDDFLTRIFVSTTCLFILILQSKLKSSLVLKFYRSMANGHG